MKKKLNTKKFSDKDAAIAEAVENLYNVCAKYNSTMFARVILDGGKFVGAYRVVSGPKTTKVKHCLFLIDCIAKFINEASKGRIKLMRTNK